MNDKLEEAIKNSAQKAADAKTADDALKYSQAALNAAHVLSVLSNIKPK